MHNRRIIAIDDDLEIWKVYSTILSHEQNDSNVALQELSQLLDADQNDTASAKINFEMSFASQGQEGFNCIKKALDENNPFSVAFIDIRMPPGWNGKETAARIRQIDPNIEIVIVTAYSDHTRDEIIRSVGTPEKLLFLRKPFDQEELAQMALSLNTKWNLARREEGAKTALSESEARFRALVETTNDMVWETDATGCFTYCSPACEMIYGFRPDEMIGKSLFEMMFPPDEALAFKQLFLTCVNESSPLNSTERPILRKDGQNTYVETNGAPVIGNDGKTTNFRGIDRDITERKAAEVKRFKIEAQYRQSQKLEAVGTLAGGIAHDFNNILSGILGYTQIVVEELPEGSNERNMLSRVMDAGERAADLVKQILAFSRQTEHEIRPINIRKIINEVTSLLHATLPATIEIRQSITTTKQMIMADPTQIHQVILNLCTNAAHAMQNNGGTLKLGLDTIEIDADATKQYPDQNPGFYLRLAVCDTGTGIEQGILEKIFDPFFTTKKNGEGTGLGLAVIHGIVKDHGGFIKVYSEMGKGTSFYIHLPTIEEEVKAEKKTAAKSIPTGTEHILLVDDEEILIDIGKLMLTTLGYQVTKSTNSIEALKLFSADPNQFDLVMTDLTMPKMTGDQLAKEMVAIRSDIPVILCSGFSERMSPEKSIAMGIRAFIMKPILRRDLAETIRKVLDG